MFFNPSRRQFIKWTSWAGAGLSIPGSFITPEWYLEKHLGKMNVETRIENEKIFTEGPAVARNGHVYFTNIPANQILKWDPQRKKHSVFKDDSHAANGLRFDPKGNLLVCEGGSGRISRIDMQSGKTTILADTFNGKGLQAPNDLDYDTKGRIYFSSRTNNPDLEKVNVRSVYRLDPDGKISQLLKEPQIHMPNGIVVSPDDRKLFLIEAHPDKDHHRNILVFDLHEDGSLSNQKVLYNFYPGRSGDGMCIDAVGNLYVAAGLHQTRGTSETLDTKPGIHVISPDGVLLDYKETPEDTITNCTFGGPDLRTLYITCKSYLLSIRTKTPGKSTYQPRP